jgi:hypothetical protein
MAKLPKGIRNVVVISDTHFGCRLGLCPPEGCSLDDGGDYHPSVEQKVVWGWWKEFWDSWVPMVTKKEPFVLVHNGDVIEGVHHGATSQISHNIKDQRNLAVQVMEKVVNRAERYYSVRGTPAHVGQSSTEEEQVAEELGAAPDKSGKHSRYELWLKFGDHLLHFLHHVGTTSSSAHEASAVNAELAAEFVEAARWNEQPPAIIIRSHRHRCIEVRVPTQAGYATAVVTPAWQLKTSFSWKVAGARLAPPQIGGVVIRLDSEGHPYTIPWVKHIGRSNIEVL